MPAPNRRDIKQYFCLTSVCLTSDVCRVHREYSWRPQLLEARRTGRRRPGVYGLELYRSVPHVHGRPGHIMAASHLQLIIHIVNSAHMISVLRILTLKGLI